MRKLILLLLAAATLLAAASCADTGGINDSAGDTTADATTDTTTEETTAAPGNAVDDMSLSDIMADIQNDVTGLPAVWDIELNSDNFAAYAFVDYKDGYEGLCSEAMINAVPHSVVLVRVPDGEDSAAVAQSMSDNANPRKWICVEAEKVVVRRYGNTIALVMSFTQTANQIISNFDTLNGSETPAEDIYVPDTADSSETDSSEGSISSHPMIPSES